MKVHFYKRIIFLFSLFLFAFTASIFSQNYDGFSTTDERIFQSNSSNLQLHDVAASVDVSKCEYDYRGLFACFRLDTYAYDRKILQVKFEQDWDTPESSSWNDVGRLIEDLICFKRAWKVKPQRAKVRIFNGPYLGIVDLNCN